MPSVLVTTDGFSSSGWPRRDNPLMVSDPSGVCWNTSVKLVTPESLPNLSRSLVQAHDPFCVQHPFCIDPRQVYGQSRKIGRCTSFMQVFSGQCRRRTGRGRRYWPQNKTSMLFPQLWTVCKMHCPTSAMSPKTPTEWCVADIETHKISRRWFEVAQHWGLIVSRASIFRVFRSIPFRKRIGKSCETWQYEFADRNSSRGSRGRDEPTCEDGRWSPDWFRKQDQYIKQTKDQYYRRSHRTDIKRARMG